ncbi:MAG: tRNA G46 methylase TrmB [Gammaproteobacteria bacterium]
MQYQSRLVDSGQKEVHSQLLKVLAIHLQSEYKKPISIHSQTIFAAVEKLRKQLNKPVILDSGCGTGSATRELAQLYDEALVIGVDKSSHRLARGGVHKDVEREGNCLLVRMDLVDFWRLALQHGWRLKKHYLLYPNPWPKAKHLRRRWHAHPVFPQLLSLGGILELRCNWRIYATEFHAAMNFITPGVCKLTQYDTQTGLSLFEQKYLASGHRLYQCCCILDNLDTSNQNIGELQPAISSPFPGKIFSQNVKDL